MRTIGIFANTTLACAAILAAGLASPEPAFAGGAASTCKSWSLSYSNSGMWVNAQCKKDKKSGGGYRDTKLSLTNYVKNDHGTLRWTSTPPGNFDRSYKRCNKCTLTMVGAQWPVGVPQFSCYCDHYSNLHAPTWSKLSLNDLNNRNGELSFR